jgi:hypothetical protein
MTPIADDFAAIGAGLARLDAAKAEPVRPAPSVPASCPPDLCDDNEVAEAYLLWCGGGV